MTLVRIVIHCVLAVWLVLLSGCATRTVHAPLPELSDLPATDARTQHLTFINQDERHELLGVLRHDQSELQLALLSPQGQRLLTLVVDVQGPRFLPGAQFEPPFTAKWLANRLAWSLWPAPALEQAFRDSGWTLRENVNGRIIQYRDRMMARITGSSDCRIIDDIESGYRLRVATLGDDSNRTESACPTD
ncbi:DUF3261 domain-containing protein [Halomonas lysinitropha]|uniref:DUF3261 domain-containing protein n=1 Tax=Halomonas lysinitropha TaxID=2607506 RepID=A0A5K1HY87_9GAMM|nr:DUF3261 domain-containing protein [Halomonas lysinitropha]VVZ94156.1 hypothetical protein HALO32_00206 [Halomonas lysinitropha]